MSDSLKQRDLAGGIALLITGLVALVPSGLCTGVVGGSALISMILSPSPTSEALNMLIMALVIGGPFVILGIILVRSGILRLRRH